MRGQEDPRMPSETGPKFSLVREDDRTEIAYFRSLEGFFVGRRDSYADFEEPPEAWPSPLTFKLAGFVPVNQQTENTALRSSSLRHLGNAELHILDNNYNSIGYYWIANVEVKQWSTSREGESEGTLTGWVTTHPDIDAAQVWNAWRQGPPSVNNLWAQLPDGRREAWLEVVSVYEPRSPAAAHRDFETRLVELDGQYITDLASFFCAMGEAVNGPGGYFGSNLTALGECARGGFGIDGGFTLRWFRADVAQQHLTREAETTEGRLSYMQIIQSTLRNEGIEVILEPGIPHIA